jgi:hypothetical protein
LPAATSCPIFIPKLIFKVLILMMMLFSHNGLYHEGF